jgi:hypothetical protein
LDEVFDPLTKAPNAPIQRRHQRKGDAGGLGQAAAKTSVMPAWDMIVTMDVIDTMATLEPRTRGLCRAHPAGRPPRHHPARRSTK